MLKNLLIYLLLLSTLIASAQITTDSIKDISLDVVYASIRKRGLERNIDVDTISLVKNGYPVYFRSMELADSLSNGTVGLTRWGSKINHYDGYIFIDRELISDINILEEVVAHECGHLWGLPHPCNYCDEIMAGLTMRPIPGTIYYYERFIDKYKVKKKWDKFFNKLK